MNIIEKCDRAWSALVKEKAGHRCERCGSGRELNSHHLIERTYWPTRFLPENGICLCASCHKGAHKDMNKFRRWATHKRDLESLEKVKHNQGKLDLPGILLRLKAEYKKITHHEIPA